MGQKIWLITGCSKGFGRALVEELLENTHNFVVATARNPDSLRDIEVKYPERVLTLKLDVTHQADIDDAVDKAIQRFGRIDVLVNNAGYGLCGALEECDMEEIKDQFNTNVFGLIAMTKAVIPYMRKQRSGHILNISSVGGLVALAGAGLYSSTKFAVEGLSEGLAIDMAHFGVKVTIIEPGPFRTDFTGASIRFAKEMPEYRESAAAQIRKYIPSVHHKQQGDPVKAAKIMIEVTQMEHPPLRLLLGNMALQRITDATQKRAAEISKYETLTRSADFDE